MHLASTSPLRRLAALSFRSRVLLLVALGGLVYVGNTWSPSSYALALRLFGAPDDGLVLGKARPIRSDEWAVCTPLFQAAVNNGMQRYNARSFYNEDLRSVCAVPLLDWGLVFKPTMWLFPLVNAAYAFSFHSYSLIVLFLLGYAALFRQLGARRSVAALLSCTLFFTSFTQYWWTALAAALAFYPWLVVLFLARGPLLPRVLAFYWLASCWLVSNFYPPFSIGLGFVTVALLLAFAPERLRQPRVLLGFGVASALACVTVVLYLQDWLTSTLHTVYPGQRRVGGGSFGLERLLLSVLPTAHYHRHEPLIPGTNTCELSVVGALYLLMVGCFLRYGALGAAWREGRLKPLRVLVPALLMMGAWLLLPLPPEAGMPLLWHMVPPVRMAYAFGLLLVVIAFVLADRVELVLRPVRALLFCTLVVGTWYVLKLDAHGIGVRSAWRDLVAAPLVLLLLVATWRGWLAPRSLHPALLGASVFVGVVSFGLFNPVQRAWPVFNRPVTDTTRSLDARAALSPDGTLAVEGFPGTILNGWGYRSASHVLMRPQLERMRALFPELPPEKFNLLFNRYARVLLTTEDEPWLLQEDSVVLPIRAFQHHTVGTRFIDTRPLGALPQAPRQEGFIERVKVEGASVVLSGWAPWAGHSPQQGLVVQLGLEVRSASLETNVRGDVATAHGDPQLIESGFTARLQLAEPLPAAQAKDLAVCVHALDRQTRQAYQLATPQGYRTCAQLQ